MASQVHPIMQDAHDFNRAILLDAIHQEVASATPLSGYAECAQPRKEIIPRPGARNIGAVGEFANRLNDHALIDARLPFAEFSVVHLRMFAKSSSATAKANAPFAVGHGNPISPSWE